MTPSELKGMAEHVRHEVDEFRKAIQRLPTLEEDHPDRKSTIEVALLHFRNLRDFFFAPGKTDDVFARDYIASWNPEEDAIFQATRRDLNKRLAHLTTWRLKEELPWKLDRMNSAIEELVSNFLNSLPPEEVSWFRFGTTPIGSALDDHTYSTHSGSEPQLTFLPKNHGK
jgi:hypothetical protein